MSDHRYVPTVGDVVHSRRFFQVEEIVVATNLQHPWFVTHSDVVARVLLADPEHGEEYCLPLSLTFVRAATPTERQDFGIDQMPRCFQCDKPDREVLFKRYVS